MSGSVRPENDRILTMRIAALKRAGASDDEIDQYVREHDVSGVQAGSSTTAAPPSALAAGGYGALQGATMGFSDEAAAGVMSPIGSGTIAENYTRRRDAMRRFGHAAQEAHPIAYGAGEIAGAVAPALVSSGASAAPSLGRAVAKTAMSGAVQGAIAGYGTGEGSQSGQLKRAVGTGIVGAGVGAGAPIAGRALGAGGRALQGGLARVGATLGSSRAVETLRGLTRGAADRIALADATAARKTLPQLRAEATGASAPEVVADLLGDPGSRTLRAASGLSPEAGQRIETTLGDRAIGRTGRVGDALANTTNQPRENLVELAKRIAQERSAQAEKEYGDAFANAPGAINDARLFELLETRPSMREAAKYAQNLAAEEGRPLPSLFDPATEERIAAPDARYLHAIKMALDKQVKAANFPDPLSGTSKDRSFGAAAAKTRDEVVELLDRVVPGYRDARANFRSESELLRAVDVGQQAIGKHPDVIADEIGQLGSTEAKNLYRLAYVNALQRDIAKTPAGGNAARRVFKGNERLGASPDVAAQLRHAFTDEQEYQHFLAQMVREGRMARTEAMALSGSRTAPIAQDMESLAQEGAGVVENVAKRGLVGGLVRSGAQAVANRARAKSPKVADAVSENYLQSLGNPQTITDYFDRLEALSRQQIGRSKAGSALARALAGAPSWYSP